MSDTDTMTNARTRNIEEIMNLVMKALHFGGPPNPEAWMELSLTTGQLKSLFFLEFEGSSSLGKLAGALGVTPPNVTGIIERLVEQKLVTRGENPENRRMLMVRLTPNGKALVERLKERNTDKMRNVLSRLNDEDLTALYRGLDALIKAWGEENK